MNTTAEPIDGGKAILAELRRAGIEYAALAIALGPVVMARHIRIVHRDCVILLNGIYTNQLLTRPQEYEYSTIFVSKSLYNQRVAIF